MRYALLSLILPALIALAACGPDAYKGTKDAPDTCRLCDDGTVDTGGTDGGTGGDTGGTGGELDTTPPGDVTVFAATAGNGQVTLTWINPSVGDFFGVLIQRATTAYPMSPSEGTLAYNEAPSATQFTDTGLTSGTTYYYTAFAYDEVANYSGGAQANSYLSILSNPTQVSAGEKYTCAADDSSVVCWGANDNGQTDVPLLSSPVQVTVGSSHTCAVDDLGVDCWGWDGNNGQIDVPSLSNPTQVSAGKWHTCAVDDTGVVCWGSNGFGQTDVP